MWAGGRRRACRAEARGAKIEGARRWGLPRRSPASARAEQHASFSEGEGGRLAQLVEHRLYTPAVTGSSPVPPTNLQSTLQIGDCRLGS